MGELKKILRRNLQECINESWIPDDATLASRAVPVVWICAKDDTVENIFRVGFDRKFFMKNSGCAMFGEGVYTSYYLRGAQSIRGGSYGNTIIKAKIPSGYYKKYLIFTETEAKYWYKDKWTIEEQLHLFTNDQQIIDSLKHINPTAFGKSHQDVAKKIGIEGIIYDWNHYPSPPTMATGGKHSGHVCVLPFDFKKVVPYAVSTDGGNTFQDRWDNNARERFEQMFDASYFLRDRYGADNISTPVFFEQYGFNFVKVRKRYSGFNMVELGSSQMKEISPIDFQSISILNAKGDENMPGIIQVEFGRKFFNAVPWLEEQGQGAFIYRDNWFLFSDLPKVADGTLDREIDAEEQGVVTESLRTTFRRFLKEAIEQKLYQGKYPIPTEEEMFTGKTSENPDGTFNPEGAFRAYTCMPAKNVTNVFRVGFSRAYAGTNDKRFSGNDESWYGTGVYCNIGRNLGIWQYNRNKYGSDPQGGALVEVYILGGIKRFLIFNERWAQTVYGNHHSIKDQVYQLFTTDTANQVWEWMEHIMKHSYYQDAVSVKSHMSDVHSGGLLLGMLKPSSEFRRLEWWEEICAKNDVRGVIYTGKGDKLCVVSYDFSAVIPFRVYNPQTGKFDTAGETGSRNDVPFAFNYENTVQRVTTSQDVSFRFKDKLKGKFKKIDWASYPGVNANDEETAYKKVQTIRGEWNYLDVNTAEVLSPVDFSSLTAMDTSDNNHYQFTFSVNTLNSLGIRNVHEISNMFFDGYHYAYIDPISEEYHTFEDIAETLRNIDLSLSNSKGGNKQIDLNNPLGTPNNI